MAEELTKKAKRGLAAMSREIRLNNASVLYSKLGGRKISDDDLDLIKDNASRYGSSRYTTLRAKVKSVDDPLLKSLYGPETRHKKK